MDEDRSKSVGGGVAVEAKAWRRISLATRGVSGALGPPHPGQRRGPKPWLLIGGLAFSLGQPGSQGCPGVCGAGLGDRTL